jgi:hypothetical protein
MARIYATISALVAYQYLFSHQSIHQSDQPAPNCDRFRIHSYVLRHITATALYALVYELKIALHAQAYLYGDR